MLTDNIIHKKLTYPFGMMMLGRSWEAGSGHRYGFSGIEKDDEFYGSGALLSYSARLYDSRIARWLKIDPLTHQYPYSSPYSFAYNSPLIIIDVEGQKLKIVGDREFRKQVKQTLRKLAKESASGREIIRKAINADQTLIISQYVNRTPNEIFEKAGSSAKLNWDQTSAGENLPSKDGNNGIDPLTTLPHITMAHELFHFVSWTEGYEYPDFIDESNPIEYNDHVLEGYPPYPVANTIPGGEILAVEFENIVRSELGYDLRKFYNGNYVFNMEVNVNEKKPYTNGKDSVSWYILKQKTNEIDYASYKDKNNVLSDEELLNFETSFRHKSTNNTTTIE